MIKVGKGASLISKRRVSGTHTHPESGITEVMSSQDGRSVEVVISTNEDSVEVIVVLLVITSTSEESEVAEELEIVEVSDNISELEVSVELESSENECFLDREGAIGGTVDVVDDPGNKVMITVAIFLVVSVSVSVFVSLTVRIIV